MKSERERSILKGLNSKQLEAVKWQGVPCIRDSSGTSGNGHLLIIAGAGTGKTRVITNRIAWLIATKRAKPEEILGLTFTDKAANEMETRVDILVPYGWVGVNIGTFHAFGQKILREFAFDLRLNPDFKVLTESDIIVFLRERIFELPIDYFRPLSEPTKYLSALIELFSRLKDENIGPEEYREYVETKLKNAETEREMGLISPQMRPAKAGDTAGNQAPTNKEEAEKELEIAKCYEKYEELLHKEGYLDTADLIVLSLKLLKEHPGVRNKLQERYKYILVDEFQDTNYAQFQLLKLLTGPDTSLAVVGDDDQAIYKFRGACLANILGFKETYPDCHIVVLNHNYRSYQAILDSAYKLITFNNPNRLEIKEKIDKSITGKKGKEKIAVKYFNYENSAKEADSIAEMIEKKIAKGYKYSDFAILTRTRVSAEEVFKSLDLKGIPWESPGSRGLYDKEEVKILICVMRMLADPDDTQAISRVISSPLYDLNQFDLARCWGVVKRHNTPLYEVFCTVAKHPERIAISEKGRSVINKFLKDYNWLIKLSTVHSAAKMLYEFITATGWITKLTHKAPSIKNELIIKNIAEFFKVIERTKEVLQDDKVPFVYNYIKSSIISGYNPPPAQADYDVDAVHILTVHKAKGLEFRVVFLAGLVDGVFPHRAKHMPVDIPVELIKEPTPELSEKDIHLQEERRLFYVGMTRAKEELILTSARDYGGKREKRVSQFVLESLDIPKDQIATEKAKEIESIARYKSKEPVQLSLLAQPTILELSSTAIDAYLTCPCKYWYIHWLKVPVPKHHTIVYGQAVHTAIEVYLKSRRAGKPINLDEMLKIFENAWDSEGFISREHEEERFEVGKKSLKKFFESEEKNGKIPMFVEEWFSFIVGTIKIKGKWDRIDNDEIIDYKTGGVDTQKKAEDRIRDSIQLPIYTLAYLEKFGKLPSSVRTYYVDTGLTGDLKNMEKQIDKAKQSIKKAAQGIRDGVFSPKPGYIACTYCPCRTLCSH